MIIDSINIGGKSGGAVLTVKGEIFGIILPEISINHSFY